MSPLYLAVRGGKEYIVGVLIAWGASTRCTDKNNNTLLHIAAETNNYKIARTLLLRGIDRKLRNTSNLTASDVAKAQENYSIQGILVIYIQKEPSFFTKMNPFKPPLSPIHNSYKLFASYVVIFIIRYVFVIIFMLPHFALELALISLALFFLNLMLFLSVHQQDPGFIQQNKGQNIAKLYQRVHSDYICAFCEVKKDLKAKHCHHCERCVQNFDHHCPWIRNCVGKNNFRTFIAFLTVCCVDFLYTSLLGMLDYFQLLQDKRRYLEVSTYHKELGLCITILCMICFCFVFPIWCLQISNLVKRTTTHERFSYKKHTFHSTGVFGTNVFTGSFLAQGS